LDRDRGEIFICRETIHLQDEYNRPDLKGVAGGQFSLLDPFAIAIGAVGAAEVFDLDVFAIENEAAMFAGDITQWDAEVAIFASSDDRHVARDGKTPALPIRPEHDHHNAHVLSASRVIRLSPLPATHAAARTVRAVKLVQRGGLQWRPTQFRRWL
jgi:hypothetical protein